MESKMEITFKGAMQGSIYVYMQLNHINMMMTMLVLFLIVGGQQPAFEVGVGFPGCKGFSVLGPEFRA